jgi:hypothetical protein
MFAAMRRRKIADVETFMLMLCYEQRRAARGTHRKDDRNNHLFGALCLPSLGLYDNIARSITLTLTLTHSPRLTAAQ